LGSLEFVELDDLVSAMLGMLTNAAMKMLHLALQAIVEGSGRPSFLAFVGECASKPTEFRQAFSYDGGFAIEPPN
jgi:hypothetical protein